MIRRDNKEIDGESIYLMIEDLEAENTSQVVSQLEQMGLEPEKIYRNLQVKKLIDIIIEKNEGTLAENGAISIKTGKYTGRSPDDQFIEDDKQTHDSVDWGKINHPSQKDKFDKIFEKLKEQVKDRKISILN